MENPALSPVSAQVIQKMSSDMKFIAILTIIEGVFTCITIIGAIVGIPILISGLRLKESANNFSAYAYSGEAFSLEQAIERQSRYFYIQKILLIVGLVFTLLYVIIIIFLLATGVIGSHNNPMLTT